MKIKKSDLGPLALDRQGDASALHLRDTRSLTVAARFAGPRVPKGAGPDVRTYARPTYARVTSPLPYSLTLAVSSARQGLTYPPTHPLIYVPTLNALRPTAGGHWLAGQPRRVTRGLTPAAGLPSGAGILTSGLAAG